MTLIRSKQRLFLILVLTVLINFTATSQASTDVTCIPNTNLRAAARKIEQGRLDHLELLLQRQNVSLLNSRLMQKDSIIVNFNLEREVMDLKVAGYEHRLSNDSTIMNLQAQDNKTLTRKLKTEKWRTRAAVVAGIAATVATVYFLK